ncbi:ATP-dependent zinc metalloprotease FtsH [Syntrophobacter fumaroxidans]|uniref:ATP-dependent zinc metalloprotease FtsH n=1 Tax=Syntrophobacter fumaroxidans (strain DSM 10017 / MPOB) TaxID=335543 RepID=FTSH_SYNFM|nr:ATP-dependent zinc metalloprotease FtsH [Syntrophobacter fumaroxidans]A0LN68.1 RecName: Full=ATP-dependent zinc metalloprotease FtsH [Syntrophobacter fumaroxidans MPOB]ABK18870.1 FtsH-2 peptidase. Metallo peptidase. MEROPS family M41 [Syntrophobacter fumaroxidans MPOB]
MARKSDEDTNPMDKFMDRLRGSPGDGGPGRPDPSQRKVHFSIWYFILALLLIVWMQTYMGEQQSEKISYSEFKQRVHDGNVQNLVIEHDRITGTMKENDGPGRRFNTIRVEDPELVKQLEAKNIRFSGDVQNPWLGLITWWLLPFAIMIFFWSFLMRRMGGGPQGVLSVGKARVKIFAEKEITITFDDVAGIDEAKGELEEIVQFLKDPGKFQRLGGRIPKGVLLVGAPGTGKTLLAKAVAGEAGVPFFSMSGSEFVEMFVGVGAARVRDLFGQAKDHAPCIIFIDELDALGKARGLNPIGGHDEREQTLNQLLVEMDGFDPRSGVIIMAATNRPEILDPALLRPGRFDRHVAIDKPDIRGREAILRVHVKEVKLGSEVDLKKIAGMTPGFVGADLANLVNEAALVAARRDRDEVTMADFQEAADRIIGGLEKKNRAMNPKEKEIVAYHEAGHALVAMLLPNVDPVNKVSIIPRGIAALGYTQQLPTEDRYLMTRNELLDRLQVLLGGRVSEEIIFGDVSTGAQNDLQRATDIARSMVMEYGMSERLGPLTYTRDPRSAHLDLGLGSRERDYSEMIAQEIDEEITRIVEDAHEKVRATLKRERGCLEKLAKILLEKESIDGEELKQFCQEVKSHIARDPVQVEGGAA